MTSKATVLAATGLGLVAGFLGGTLSVSDPDPLPAAEPRVAELRQRVEVLESRAPGPSSSLSDKTAMRDRLWEQDRRIRALEAKLAAAMGSEGSGASPAMSERDRERTRLEAMETAPLLTEITRKFEQIVCCKVKIELGTAVIHSAQDKQITVQLKIGFLFFPGFAKTSGR